MTVIFFSFYIFYTGLSSISLTVSIPWLAATSHRYRFVTWSLPSLEATPLLASDQQKVFLRPGQVGLTAPASVRGIFGGWYKPRTDRLGAGKYFRKYIAGSRENTHGNVWTQKSHKSLRQRISDAAAHMMINKQMNIPSSLAVSHRSVLYLAMIGVFIELSLLLWYINVSSARLPAHKIRFPWLFFERS